MSALALQDLLPPPTTLAGLKRQVQSGAAKRPGVYQFLGPSGEVVYVGKARNLRQRLLSYFSAPYPESKSAQLIRCATAIRWRYLPSEFAALLEELRLILALRPRYNVKGTYQLASLAFVRVTAGQAPRLVVAGYPRDPAGRYYGPFRGRGPTLRGIQLLADLLGLRDCAERTPMRLLDQTSLFEAPLSPLCIRHELGSCLGPCAAKVGGAGYARAVRDARDFLEGLAAHPLDVVLDRMADAAAERQYERAAHWRGKLDDLTHLFTAVSRLRAAVEALSFVYSVKDETGGDEDRVYLIDRGTVRASAAPPTTPIEREAFASRVDECLAGSDQSPVARTGAEMMQLLLVMSWFRQHPEAYEDTTSLKAWAGVTAA